MFSFPIVSGFASAVAKANWGGGRRENLQYHGSRFHKNCGKCREKTSTTETTSERAELSGRAFRGGEEHPGPGIPSSAPKQSGRERVQPRFGEAGRGKGASASSPRWSHLPAQPRHGTLAKLCVPPPPAPALPPHAWAASAKAPGRAPSAQQHPPLLPGPRAPSWGCACFQPNVCREENQQQRGGEGGRGGG